MALTPVRHVRVPDELWDAAEAKAKAEFRSVAEVIRECLRNYVGVLERKPPMADPLAGVITDLSDAEVDGFMEAVSEGREGVPVESPAADSPRGWWEASAGRGNDPCAHPKSRVHKGLCGACGAHVGTHGAEMKGGGKR